jgi:hypothetical protein
VVNIRGSLDFFNKSIANRVKIKGESKLISNSVSIDSTLLSSNLSAEVIAALLTKTSILWCLLSICSIALLIADLSVKSKAIAK